MATAIDFSPLVPVINDTIQYVIAPLAGIAITVVSGFLVQFLIRHGLLKNQQQAQIVQAQISALADRVVTYNAPKLAATLTDDVRKLKVAAPSQTVATLANYAIAQAPDLLKKGGFDPTTTDGQAKIVRLITARLDATPPVPAPTETTVIIQPKPVPVIPGEPA